MVLKNRLSGVPTEVLTENDSHDAAVRVRLDIAYDGTNFHGWGRQPVLRTVQGTLEEAIATLLRRADTTPSLVVAGRTDAGVHAVGQVAHLDLTQQHSDMIVGGNRPGGEVTLPELLARRLNGILGASSDVVIRGASVAAPGFDARFSATWRRYEYRIADSAAARDPLQRHRTVWHPGRLDAAAMDAAAKALTGLHDFAAYCKPRPDATTIRTLQIFEWRRDSDGVLVAELRADAFCHSMVRGLVGACVAVGDGKLDASRPGELLAEANRSSEFIVMQAKGLTLAEVGYPPVEELASRAELTRARRTL
jgi:tRNA pseudouridine38-40 synthase